MTWPRRLGIAALPALFLGAGACGQGTQTQDEVPHFELVEVSRIGSVEGPDALSDVAEVLVLGDRILVLERQTSRVVQFDRSGSRVGGFGGGGPGPGEFSRPTALGATGDRIWVADAGSHEMELFTPDGEPATTLRIEIPQEQGGVPAAPNAFLSTGNLIAAPASTRIGAALAGDLEHETYYLVDREGEILDTLYRRPVPPTDFVQGELGDGRMFMAMHALPERPEVNFFRDGSGMVVVERWQASVADSASYRVKVWNAAGELETDRAVPYEPVSAEGWMEQEIAEIRGRAADASEGEQAMTDPIVDALRENWSERRFYPPVTSIVAGADGTILIRREETGTSTVRWEMLGRDGSRLAAFTTPADMRIEAATREEVWAVVTDELDVPYVVRYRLEGRDG